MAASMPQVSVCCISLILLFLASLCQGLYEDQIGKFDWKQEYVGEVSHLNFEGKRLLVGTKHNVVASLNARNGQIVWRQVLEEDSRGRIDALLVKDKIAITVSGNDHIRSWDVEYGGLNWEEPLDGAPDAPEAQACLMGSSQDTMVVLSAGKLLAFNVNGQELFRKVLPSSDGAIHKFLHCGRTEINVIGVVPNSHVSIATYSDSGNVQSQSPVPADWVKKDTRCLLIADGHLVCYEPQLSSLRTLALKKGQAFSTTLLQELGLQGQAVKLTSLNHRNMFVVQLSASHLALLSVGTDAVKLVLNLPKVSAVSVSSSGDIEDTLVTIGRQGTENAVIRCLNLKTLKEIPEISQEVHLAHHHGTPVGIQGFFFKKRDGSTGHRTVVLSEDQSIVMFQQGGKMSWIREEAISSILSVEMVDLPVSENQAKYEDEFGAQQAVISDDIGTKFVKRLTTQLSQVKSFVVHLQQQLLKGPRHQYLEEDNEFNEDEELTRDEFSINKMIVAVTAPGKLFGIESSTGRIIWRHLLPALVPFERQGKQLLLLFVQRTTAHFPNPPQCAVLGRHKVSGHGLLYLFDPITGIPTAGTPAEGADTGYRVVQATTLGVTDDHHLKGLFILDAELKVHVYPEHVKGHVKAVQSTLFLFNADVNTGLITGYRIQEDIKTQSLHAVELWTINLPKETQTITNVVGKRPTEHVHSPGKPLADRSVLYKYLNPNLVAITAEGETEDSQQKVSGVLNIYLVDSVTGDMIFQASHKKARGPVHLVHTENWVVYNYWNEKNRRNEITVVELYEGTSQTNATVFSSLHPPPPPIVGRQSYILPHGISAMADTITEMGITAKSVLLAFTTGNVAEVSKFMLDPRRPLNPTMADREEGIPPYIPELLVAFEAMINYNQTVLKVHGIQTAAAGLESTSLSLVYGLDLFFTQVTPSRKYDVLKEDFDYFFISAVLIGMIVVSVVSQKLAARKALNRAWT
ncbi:ER membrane protein complex subunit 1-like isoform X1 [Lingula anatina]|uniref:ER membrane protein complex subunit 1 n=1 Tax=Lingula anatina TaxID=7574 RepID=A0A1S3JH25_LINAN|nr:ER membrane protein complex subunit 1-like isoform X1 [Lingula anatina]|eukprot:XP_013409710.1 ER membrane protein complex subunit 1-like isoform X1 [Lingula anatina]